MAFEVDEIVDIPEARLRYFGGPGKMLLPSRPTVETWVRKIPPDRLLTTDRLRRLLADQFEVEGVCPVTTQKVLKLIARDAHADVAYWRVIQKNGGLFSVFPGGAEAQATRLRDEGFTIEPRGKTLAVRDFSAYLADFGPSVDSLVSNQEGDAALYSQPQIEQRAEQPYVGIRFQTTMQAMGPDLFPQRIDALFAWLGQRGLSPVGGPILRYYTIDMAGYLDIELGLPVAQPTEGDSQVTAGALPAGRYAFLVYTGAQNGVEGNRRLLEWGSAQGLTWDQWETPQGDAFGARYETFLTGPEDDPDPARWDTEVAIRLADDQSR